MTARIVLIGIFISNILQPTRSLYDFRFKSYNSNDLDLWPMFYWLSHKVGMKYWNLLAKFHRHPSRINGWYGSGYCFKNALCFIMGYLVAMEIRVTLFWFVHFVCMIHSIGPIKVLPILRSICTTNHFDHFSWSHYESLYLDFLGFRFAPPWSFFLNQKYYEIS